jgi:signal transduction histidine kinase
MVHSPNGSTATVSNLQRLLGYVADLEVEVDRLRRQARFVEHEVRETLKWVRSLCADGSAGPDAPSRLAEVDQAVAQLAAVLRDVHEPSGYHPAHDQVVAIAVRPLIEQIFRWQQRLVGAPQAVLELKLESEHVEWFPARLRHILDNLLSNALKYRDPEKAEAWVQIGLRVSPDGYELRVSDNGLGLPSRDGSEVFEVLYRTAPARAAGLGVGLPVVKLLVEQSGGRFTADSGTAQGSTFVAVLPRYDLDDFLI